MMKKILISLFSIFCCLSCVEEDQAVDITVMPDATTVGADTFGCLVDGWLYVGGRFSLIGGWGWTVESEPSISFIYDKEYERMNVAVQVKSNKWIRFMILLPQEGKEVSFTNAQFGQEDLDDGEVIITRFDTKKKIISGTFAGGSITHGRFDVHYVNCRYEGEHWHYTPSSEPE